MNYVATLWTWCRMGGGRVTAGGQAPTAYFCAACYTMSSESAH